MNTYVQKWLDEPDGGGTFTCQRDLIRAHPENCPSLDDVWVPRKGGVSDITETYGCDGCGIDFFWRGLYVVQESCVYSNHWVCLCCSQTFVCGCTE